MLEIYETYYGINDFTIPGRPLKAVAMHPKEKYWKNSIYDFRLRKYLELDINKRLGMSFEEYISLTRAEIENINRVVAGFINRVNKLEEQTQRELKDEQKREQQNISNLNKNQKTKV